jgi:hypothetical protein
VEAAKRTLVRFIHTIHSLYESMRLKVCFIEPFLKPIHPKFFVLALAFSKLFGSANLPPPEGRHLSRCHRWFFLRGRKSAGIPAEGDAQTQLTLVISAKGMRRGKAWQ